MTAVQQSQGIENFFNNLFSFMRRKTDFFSYDAKSREIVSKPLEEHLRLFQEDKKRQELVKKKQEEEKRKKEQEEAAKRKQGESTAQVEEISDEEAQRIIEEQERKRQLREQKAAFGSKSPATAEATTAPSTESES